MKNFMNCGIYQIKNLITGDLYIGQSVNLNKRKTQHFYRLRKNNHHSSYMQNSFNKYGESKFEFTIILYCEPNELTFYEQLLVDKWNPAYNTCKEIVDSPKGLKRTDEFKQKIREIWKNRIRPPNKENRKKKEKELNKGYENYCVTTFGKSLYKILSYPETEEEQKIKEKYYEDMEEIENKEMQRGSHD
jgi:group I intron endonuclease